jgi:hypothetical protein
MTQPDPHQLSSLVDVCGLDLTQELIWTVPGILSAEECQRFIARIEEAQPTPAPITTLQGFVMRPEIRNNSRVIFDDLRLAAELYDRVAQLVPPRLRNARLVGVNERFRCYRYTPGQRFALHYDGSFVRNRDELSLLTFIIYLNDGFAGGETAFPEQDRCITPKTGTALFFQHRLLHEGCAVRSGVKYVLRSDIMYRQVRPF